METVKDSKGFSYSKLVTFTQSCEGQKKVIKSEYENSSAVLYFLLTFRFIMKYVKKKIPSEPDKIGTKLM